MMLDTMELTLGSQQREIFDPLTRFSTCEIICTTTTRCERIDKTEKSVIYSLVVLKNYC